MDLHTRVGDLDEESVRQFFEIIGQGPKAEIVWNQGRDLVSLQDGKWIVGLDVDSDFHAVIHEGSHQIYSTFKSEDFVQDSRVRYLANVIEDARVDRLADILFQKQIFEQHRQVLLREGVGDSLYYAVGCIAFDLPYPPGLKMQTIKIAELFRSDIVRAASSSDQIEAISVAIKIAKFLDWNIHREEQRKQRLQEEAAKKKDAIQARIQAVLERRLHRSRSSGNTSVIGSMIESLPPEPDLRSDKDFDREYQEDIRNLNQLMDQVDIKLNKELEAESLELTDPPSFEKEVKETILQGLQSTLNKIKSEEKKDQRKKAERQDLISRFEKKGEDVRDFPHDIVVSQVQTRPIEISKHVQGILEDTVDPAEVKISRHGKPSQKVWKTSYGEMNVFETPPRHKGRLFILCDYSGSMRKWWPLIEQAISALTHKFPTSETVFFTWDRPEGRSNLSNLIIPVPVGSFPVNPPEGDTPLCAAMQYMRSRIDGDFEGSSAIILTDGDVNKCVPSDYDTTQEIGNGSAHVAKLAYDFYRRGMRYVTLLFDNVHINEFPQELAIEIRTEADLDKLADAIKYLVERGHE